MSNQKIYCDKSCTCTSQKCRLLKKHYIKGIENRTILNSFVENNFNSLLHSEDDRSTQKPCEKGLFCLNCDCQNKHGCNLEFRKEMFDTWNNFKIALEIYGNYEVLAMVVEDLKANSN